MCENDKEKKESGTTLVGMFFYKDFYVNINIGDSVCFKYKDKLKKITIDHKPNTK